MGEIQRGEIWWADLPVLVVQAGSFNRSIQTASVAVVTSNLDLADVPGYDLSPARATWLPFGLPENASQLLTLDRGFLSEHAGTLPPRLLGSVDEGLRLGSAPLKR